jgi:hypothetical protein
MKLVTLQYYALVSALAVQTYVYGQDDPSDFPSSFPSNFPSNFASDFVSDFPTLIAGISARCADTATCSGLSGDCCPTIDGVDLYCCGDLPGLCADSPSCVSEGRTEGNCCPNDEGVLESCCELPFASCAAHSQCAHLSGECCPTRSGAILDCCEPDPTLTEEIVQGLPDTASCAATEACSNLSGNCCPTDGGVFMFCCGNYLEQCASHPQCAALNLTGDCCPSEEGIYLDCCSREFASYLANPQCPSFGESLCPDGNGVFDDCCEDDEAARGLLFQTLPASETSTGTLSFSTRGPSIFVLLLSLLFLMNSV